MSETIVKYKKFSEEEQQHWREFYEEIRLHDEASALGGARREGRAEGIAEGRTEGILKALSDLVKDGLITLEEAAKRSNMTVDDFKNKTGLQ